MPFLFAWSGPILGHISNRNSLVPILTLDLLWIGNYGIDRSTHAVETMRLSCLLIHIIFEFNYNLIFLNFN